MKRKAVGEDVERMCSVRKGVCQIVRLRSAGGPLRNGCTSVGGSCQGEGEVPLGPGLGCKVQPRGKARSGWTGLSFRLLALHLLSALPAINVQPGPSERQIPRTSPVSWP